jgi:hypothetical protein
MISRTHLTVLFWFAVLLWAAMLILEGVSIPSAFFKPGSTVLGALVLLMGAFERWIWRWPILHPWFVSEPDLQGTWRGEVHSSWVDPATGERLSPIEAFLVIKQTFSTIRIRLLTQDSSSELLAGSLITNQEDAFLIVGTFLNVPRILVRDISPIHHGTIMLNVRGETNPTLEGGYWTDRLTRGELNFSARSKKQHGTFNHAASAMSKRAAS